MTTESHVVRVEKLMALKLSEFQLTIAPLVGSPLGGEVSAVELPLGAGTVRISYEPRPSVRYGGLLDIPRALVTLAFSNVAPAEQTAYVKRFDFTFQRGGG